MALKVKGYQHPKYVYARSVVMRGRKSCPDCGTKLLEGEKIYSLGEYEKNKWYTIRHFCFGCYYQVLSMLSAYEKGQQRPVYMKMYQGEARPRWFKVEKEQV